MKVEVVRKVGAWCVKVRDPVQSSSVGRRCVKVRGVKKGPVTRYYYEKPNGLAVSTRFRRTPVRV